MKMLRTDRGVIVDVYVKPDSREFTIRVEDDELVVCCRETPVKGRVNRELSNELSKLFKRRIDVVAGFTSKQKKVLINDISLEEVADVLSKCQRV